MLFDVHYKTDTADRGLAQVDAANEAEATIWAEKQGWEVELLRPAQADRRSKPVHVVDDTPDYTALWLWAGILRLLGVALAGLGVFFIMESPARHAASDLGIPLPFTIGLCIIGGMEVYVCGEAVAAFRHLVQNSWAWRRQPRSSQ